MNYIELSFDISKKEYELRLDDDIYEKPFWEAEVLLKEKIVYVQFGKSKSKLYDKIIELAEKLPGYQFDGEMHSFIINTVKEYVENEISIEYVISVVNKWKGSYITLNGKKFTGKTSVWHFKKVLQANAGEYGEVIYPEVYYDFIPEEPIEDLPLPYVIYPEQYGTFFSFKENGESTDVYFCECEREALTNYLILKQFRKIFFENVKSSAAGTDKFSVGEEKELLSNIEKSMESYKFRKGICHKCNGKVPKEDYCHPMYGTAFKRKYGWFINQKYFECGIEYLLEGRMALQKVLIIRDKCSADVLEVWDKFIWANEECEKNPDSDELYKLAKDARRDFEKCIENKVRKEFGFKNVGEAWVSETTLANIVKTIYPDCEIKTHYRPKWLEGLELDIFVKEKNLGIEYQGQQHYHAVEHWGGEKQLAKQKEHDARKVLICRKHNIKLLAIKYDESLTETHIREKLREIQC